MKTSRRPKSNSVLYRYILSFLLVALIPLLIISTFFYRYNLDGVKKNVDYLNQYQLMQIRNVFEREYEQYFSVAQRLDQDPNLHYSALSGSIPRRKAALDAFKSHAVDTLSAGRLFLFVRGEDIVYSKTGIMSFDAMSSNVYQLEPEEKQRLLNWLEEISLPSVERFTTYEVSGGTGQASKPKVIFQFPIHAGNTSVFFIVDQGDYLKLFSDMVSNIDGYAFVFDNSGEEIVSNKNAEEVQVIREAALSQTGELTSQVTMGDGTSYTVSSARSSRTGWVCAVAIPDSIYSAGNLREVSFLILIFTVVAFVCIAASIVLSFLYYRPLRRIIQEVGTGEAETEGRGTVKGNEFDVITGYFRRKTEQNRELREIISSQTPYVKERVLDILLYSDISQEEFNRGTRHIDLGFDEPYYFAVTVEPGIGLDASQYSRLGREMGEIVAAIPERVPFPVAVHLVERVGEQNLVLVVNIREAEHKDAVLAQVRQEVSALSCRYPQIAEGCGSVYGFLWGLRKSYQEASVVSGHNIHTGTRRAAQIEDIQRLIGVGGKDYPANIQALFVQQVKQGDFEGARDSLLEIGESRAFEREDGTLRQYICFQIINDLVRLAEEVYCVCDECGLDTLLSYEGEQDFQRKMLAAARKICDIVNSNRHHKSEQLKERVVVYITDNYHDPDLGLDSMGEHFGLSAAYLSRFIREQTGLNMKDCVTRIRIQEAKRMLLQTELSVNDIVARVGYYNASSFIRKFRGAEGMTPGEYRLQNRKGMNA